MEYDVANGEGVTGVKDGVFGEGVLIVVVVAYVVFSSGATVIVLAGGCQLDMQPDVMITREKRRPSMITRELINLFIIFLL